MHNVGATKGKDHRKLLKVSQPALYRFSSMNCTYINMMIDYIVDAGDSFCNVVEYSIDVKYREMAVVQQ